MLEIMARVVEESPSECLAAAATKAAYAPKCADRVCQVWLSLCSQIVLSRIHINMINKRTEIVDKSFAR